MLGGADDKAVDAKDDTSPADKPAKHSFLLHLTPSHGSKATRWHGRMKHMSEGDLVHQTEALSVTQLIAALTNTIKKITGKPPKGRNQ